MHTETDAPTPDQTGELRYVKGHGTQNDFVILTDPDAALDLDATLVTAVCDRQRGVGADGLLRVARAAALAERGVLPELPEGVAPGDWFMDYRNADGSIAEMCGNGVRVFAHFVRASGLVNADEFTVGSRAGGRPVVVHSFDDADADVSVEMGPVSVTGSSSATVGTTRFDGVVIDVGNPHLACVVDGLTPAALAAIDLTGAVAVDAGVFPDGANVEFVTPAEQASSDDAPLTARMRVHERGVGETRSCGTGLVAAGMAALLARDETDGTLVITVPGGDVEITIAEGSASLRGPSKLVADGRLRPGWAR